MISSAHVLAYSKNPEADRAFFRDILGFRFADAGEGWLICALPPAECALHPMKDPGGESSRQLLHGGHHLLGAVLYFMCDDVHAQIALLKSKNVTCTEVEAQPWGTKTTFQLPSGGESGLYQPTHPSPLQLL
jgi:catechol 2,3-dioxygenase-like lactoylglutathione lyase family enzyme